MAYITDYSTTVPYNTSIAITSTDVANATADLLVANFGYALISHATAGVASGTTNYAELSWQNLKVRIYNTTTSAYNITFAGYFDGSTSYDCTVSANVIPSITGASVTVSLRKIAYKGGNICQALLASGAWVTVLIQSMAQNIATEQTYYALSCKDINTTGLPIMISDGNKVSQYYHPAYYPYDATGSKQILTQIMTGSSSAESIFSRTFILKYIYGAGVLTFRGVAEINGKTFYVFNCLAYEVA